MEYLDVVELLRAAQTLERNVSVALMYSGLRVPQFRLLDILAGRGQATVTEMSDYLHITRATASVMINDMIKAGILAVDQNPDDRRSFHIRLSEMGMNKLHVARSDLAAFNTELAKQYSPEMIRMLNEFARLPAHRR